ncbi:TPA: hypothetical protein NIA45_004702 [Pseudomonas aeruginosa]|nr:hypothetical protein [Pseudomonas aeruginosa]
MSLNWDQVHEDNDDEDFLAAPAGDETAKPVPAPVPQACSLDDPECSACQ